jgi:hypothetical protein
MLHVPFISFSFIDRHNNTWQREEITKVLITQFSLTFSYVQIFSSSCSDTLNLCSSLNVRNQVPNSYKTSKITVRYVLTFTSVVVLEEMSLPTSRRTDSCGETINIVWRERHCLIPEDVSHVVITITSVWNISELPNYVLTVANNEHSASLDCRVTVAQCCYCVVGRGTLGRAVRAPRALHAGMSRFLLATLRKPEQTTPLRTLPNLLLHFHRIKHDCKFSWFLLTLEQLNGPLIVEWELTGLLRMMGAGISRWYSAGLRAGWSRVRVPSRAGNFLVHHCVRPPLGPTEPPNQWVPLRYSCRGVKLTTHFHLVPRSANA